MTTFTRVLASSVGVGFVALGLVTSAQADGYSAPRGAYERPFSWTGFYLGGSVGALRATSDEAWRIDPNNQADAAGAIAARQSLSNRRLRDSSITGGPQAGYNLQLGAVVVGIEGDVSWANASASHFFPTLAPLFGAAGDGNNLTQEANVDWFATARARLGYSWDRTMLYATGGYAAGGVRFFDSSHYAAGVTQTASESKTMSGWALGGGIETALSRNWSVKAEYLHVDLGKETTYSTLQPAFAVAYFHDHKVTLDIVRVGVNYKFGEDGARSFK